ncbi:hypothetical protein [Geobacillus jurassicus]|uniref:Uncharacterized protein n=1 Tax=Geobacillus jurassicus TaxID=235932 RepID=A0ABV6GTE5_9BACL|nr:hypothetical protein [Geobacillus jurassicus]
MSGKEKVVHFKYLFPDDYNPVYVNGAHGGISPQGEIVVNFYFERRPLPPVQGSLHLLGSMGIFVCRNPKQSVPVSPFRSH